MPDEIATDLLRSLGPLTEAEMRLLRDRLNAILGEVPVAYACRADVRSRVETRHPEWLQQPTIDAAIDEACSGFAHGRMRSTLLWT